MEHLPLLIDSGFTTLIWVLIAIAAAIGIAGALLILGKQGIAGYVLFGLAFAVLTGTGFALVYSPSSPAKLEAAWLADVAEQFNDRYGTKLTAEDVEELKYPEAAPEGRVALGTLTLSTGREVALVFNDGRAYLRIIGEELPFD